MGIIVLDSDDSSLMNHFVVQATFFSVLTVSTYCQDKFVTSPFVLIFHLDPYFYPFSITVCFTDSLWFKLVELRAELSVYYHGMEFLLSSGDTYFY